MEKLTIQQILAKPQPIIRNLCKKRKYPTYADREEYKDANVKTKKRLSKNTDTYAVYDMNSKSRGTVMNTWFKGDEYWNKDGTPIHLEIINTIMVDEETARHLYHEKYNCLRFVIRNSYNPKKPDEYYMYAHIKSIDDSCYRIEWRHNNYQDLLMLRNYMMGVVNNMKQPINGYEFLDICVAHGADETTKDYS